MVVLFKSGSIARIATFLIAAAVLAACLAVTVPREASAIGPFIVDGKVTDNAGRPIVGASVVAAMYNGTTLVASQGTTTDGDGMYTISFATDLWKAGFNVTSTA